MNPALDSGLHEILDRYRESFQGKIYAPENQDSDVLMEVFGITPQLKREHRQYWGRELGMCWERIVSEVFRSLRSDYGPPPRIGDDDPCDFTVGRYAIDTKYRIGSGDSGTLRKFRRYGQILLENGYAPTLLILREDNLRAAVAACERGGWDILTGAETFDYLKYATGFDLESHLERGWRGGTRLRAKASGFEHCPAAFL